MTKPEPICIELTDDSHLTALMHVEGGKLHLNLGWLGTFVIKPESAYQVCERVLEILPIPYKVVRTNG